MLIKNIKYTLILIFIAGFIPLFFPHCANIVPPTGGPRDTIPPEVVRSSPPNFSTNSTRSEIHIEFDEFIELRNINQQFIITPPQIERPEFRSRGRNLSVNIKGELIENTTYTLNFGNAIVDLNEGNPLSNYEFVFSTGDVIDSLSYSGIVLNAYDNQPVEGAIVMLYSDLRDSIPYRQIPLYASRTDEDGRFQLNNLRGDTFLVFAIRDANNNYLYDRPGEEAIAFRDSFISPDTVQVHHDHHDDHHDMHDHHHNHDNHNGHNHDHDHDRIHDQHIDHDHMHENQNGHHHPNHDHPNGNNQDQAPVHTDDSTNQTGHEAHDNSLPLEPGEYQTEWGDTIEIKAGTGIDNDSVHITQAEQPAMINFPAADTLYMFQEATGRQYISRNERNRRGELLFIFNLPLEREWTIEPLDFDPPDEWMLVEKNNRNDSIRYWITDPGILSIDNMRFNVSYWATGPSDSLQKVSDTLNMNFTAARSGRRTSNEEADNILEPEFSIRREGNQDLNKNFIIKFPEPLSDLDLAKTRLISADDNGTMSHDFELTADSVKIRNYHLVTDWVPAKNYRLISEPGAFQSFYGAISDSIDFNFTTREADHYGRILVDITGISDHTIIQLLDEGNNVLEENYLSEDSEVVFDYLHPGNYMLKAIFDTNNNQQWDTGNYLEGIQPERVTFFRDVITVRSNWDIEEDWDFRQ